MEQHPVPVESDGVGSLLPNALSVDVEDYYHVEAFADRIRPEDWSQFPSRVVGNTHRVLEIFERKGVKGTFFILGCVAEHEPSLVREIAAAGHEIACHSHMHRRVFTMTPHDFREDLRRARGAIEDACGAKVEGFRAPTFSIVSRSLWAIEILAEEGFLYDSSVFPIRHDLYGFPEAPRVPFRWRCKDGRAIYEFPLTTVRLMGHTLPAAGGGYLRILPMWYTRWALRKVRSGEGRQAVIYFHPWELDPGQPRLQGRLKSRMRHYFNLSRMERRVDDLLGMGGFAPMRALLDGLRNCDDVTVSALASKPESSRSIPSTA